MIAERVKDCPSLNLDLDPAHTRTGDARFRITAKRGGDEVVIGHIGPETPWHTLHLMQSGAEDGLKIGEQRGRRNAVEQISENFAKVLGIKL